MGCASGRREPGEELVTLDGVTRVLGTRPADAGRPLSRASDCLICDAEDRPVGIGGIMGGQSSEITAEASRVLLEVGYFVPLAIARTARRVGLRSEASVRFERGVDPIGHGTGGAAFLRARRRGAARCGRASLRRWSRPGLLDAHPVAVRAPAGSGSEPSGSVPCSGSSSKTPRSGSSLIRSAL